MSANYVDFDPELQALGYRAKTWDYRYYTIVAPDGSVINTTPFEDDIKGYAEAHRMNALEEAQALKKPMIEIWAFADAPRELQNLSPHAGDEDYIVIVRYGDDSINYLLDSGSFLGVYQWSKHEHNGEVIWIGAHS